ncbi:MAG: response regulator [Huintestinicola sp.]|uniref:response regulator n=1 Tax=Huintestinicola sp. TaxID=2981661 RepID=UPI003F0E571B
MRYKILVNGGSSALLRDFFVNSTGFTCMSTSGYWTDLSAHYEMFKPDAYVCIAEYADVQLMSQIKRLKTHEEYGSVPVVVITNEDCFEMYSAENENEKLIDLILSRPITISAICDKINRLFRNIEEEKERIAREQERLAKEQEEADRRATEELEKKSLAEKKHILIVDDDKNVLKLLKSALEDRYDVTAIISGRMALKFLDSKTPDLIFLDYQMPVETGPEVFRRIKKLDSAKDIPVVFLTGIADREKITEVLSLKPQGYLLKPIDMERVNETIRTLLG